MIVTRAAVHPFPARMAPELAATKLSGLSSRAIVLDPMMGSGTFPVAAAKSGHLAFGCDTDPLALTIAHTLADGYGLDDFVSQASFVVNKARKHRGVDIPVDRETSNFIDFWFDAEARLSLASLAVAIEESPRHLVAPLWCSFSRLIITKDAGASRARDVSHSRPHRVRDTASFDPIEKFEASANSVAKRVASARQEGYKASGDSSPTIVRADARRLPLGTGSVDAVMTSPPYLVAIDYLRGHRMSLVWMGYSISYLRSLRSGNIGSEAGLVVEPDLQEIAHKSYSGDLRERGKRIVGRYVRDMDQVIAEIARVVKRGGSVSLVMANAKLNGVDISIEEILLQVADRNGLSRAGRVSRPLPESRRYLPPPRESSSALDGRMKEEVILTFERS